MVELNIITTKQLKTKRIMEYELYKQKELNNKVFIVVEQHNVILVLDNDTIEGHLEWKNDYIDNEEVIVQFSNNVIRYDTYKNILSSKINYIIENYLLTIE